MTTGALWPWVALLLLGAVHGLNPAMGWLFAVGIGMQEDSRRAVWRAIVPLAAGHALAILAAVGAALVLGLVIPGEVLRTVIGATLVIWGVCAVVFRYHPRLGGMRVGRRQLVLWSFLMASAHGAGMMAVPATLRLAQEAAAARPAMVSATDAVRGHVHHAAALPVPGSLQQPSAARAGIVATALHSLAYVVAMAGAAVLVFEFLGLRVLRSAWINLEVIWASTLAITGLLTALV
jgi:hypothetical protein